MIISISFYQNRKIWVRCACVYVSDFVRIVYLVLDHFIFIIILLLLFKHKLFKKKPVSSTPAASIHIGKTSIHLLSQVLSFTLNLS